MSDDFRHNGENDIPLTLSVADADRLSVTLSLAVSISHSLCLLLDASSNIFYSL